MIAGEQKTALSNLKESSIAIEKIDLDVCDACKVCVNACPMDVIRFDDEAEKPYIAYPEDCIWCYACEYHCPLHCIEVRPTEGRREVPGW